MVTWSRGREIQDERALSWLLAVTMGYRILCLLLIIIIILVVCFASCVRENLQETIFGRAD